MAGSKSKIVILIIAVCFAILQAMQPLIHAHLDAEHPIHNAGLHVGDEQEEAMHESTVDTGLSETPHVSHTISVASGIKKDVELNLFLPVYAVVVFVVLSLYLHVGGYLLASNTPRLRQFLRHLSPAPRAPPLL